jgi:hypothetical protein
MFKKTLLGAAVATLIGFGSAANAGVVIDLFKDPSGTTQSVTTSTLGVGGSSANEGGAYPANQVIGRYRELYIEKTADACNQVANPGCQNVGASTLTAGFGELALSNDDGNKSKGIVTWDGGPNDPNTVQTTGLGGIDLTAGNATQFLAKVISADLGFDYVIRVWDMDGNSSALSASVVFRVGFDATDCGADPTCVVGPIDATYNFEWFTRPDGAYVDDGLSFVIDSNGVVDFTNIGALQLELSNARTFSVDLSIGSIESVPEPGTLALLGVGILGAAVARRRVKVA